MERILWILTILGVVLGSVIFLQALTENSAPRQAASAGMALCCAVLPYVLARSVRGFKSADPGPRQLVSGDPKPSAPKSKHRSFQLTR